MSSFNAPRFIPPRYVEGDIYGFSVLLNNDVSSIDNNFPVWPFWNGEESAGGLTGGLSIKAREGILILRNQK